MNIRKLDTESFKDYLERTEHIARVKTADTFVEDLVESFEKPKELTGDKLPSVFSHSRFRFRPGEVTLWTGFNGHYKSMILGQTMMSILTKEFKSSCIASMEMHPRDTLNRMSRQFFEAKRPSEGELREFVEIIGQHCYIYDHIGTAKSKDLLDAIAYCGHELKLKHFVIDSLMKTEIDDDDYVSQKKFVSNICAIAKDTGMHVHLVAHSRKGKDENSRPGKMDVRGSGTLTDQCDNVLSMWFAKTPEAKKQLPNGTDAILACHKQRHGAWEGEIPLRFNPDALTFVDAYGSY